MEWRKLTDATRHFGGVIAAARWQGRAKQLEKPSSPAEKNGGKGTSYNWQTRKSEESERVAEGFGVAKKRSNVRGAKGPCCVRWL
jgi:hypothetical protein